MPRSELVAPTGQVYERLGLTKAPTVPAPTRRSTVNIRRLNITDPGPAHGNWIDLHATLEWMRLRSMEQGGPKVLEAMIADLAEVTA